MLRYVSMLVFDRDGPYWSFGVSRELHLGTGSWELSHSISTVGVAETIQ